MARKSSGSRSSGLGAIGFTFIALLLTGCTAFLLAQVLKGQQLDVTPMRDVVVASRDIKASVEIKPEYFKVVKMPIDAIPKGSFSMVSQIFPPSKINKPQVFVNNLYMKEIVSKHRISDPKRGTGFASLVPEGFRAFTLRVDSSTTRASVAYPGAFVDVLSTMRRDDSKGSITRLAVQNVQVLAVNGIQDVTELQEDIQNSKRRSRTDVLTILVNPDQGEALTLAANEGKINVLLRNSNDQGSISTQGVTTNELTTTSDEDAAQVSKKKGRATSARSRFRRSFRRRSARQKRSPQPAPTNRRGSTQRLSFD